VLPPLFARRDELRQRRDRCPTRGRGIGARLHEGRDLRTHERRVGDGDDATARVAPRRAERADLLERHARTRQARLLDELARRVYPETELLRQVAGVGTITALAFVLTLEDPRRFANSRAVGPFLGLTVRKRQSGSRDPALRITKAGDPFLRRLLLQGAHYILARGPDCDLRRFGLRVMARRGRAKAAIAVTRAGRPNVSIAKAASRHRPTTGR